MPYELPVDPREERRARIGRWLGFAFAAVLVALVAYFAYCGFEGSRQLTEPPVATDCRTPALMGWEYEAINYDQATDVALQSVADPLACTLEPVAPGTALTSSDGVPLAGWYIPAGSGLEATGPTVVITHGYGANKSTLLDRAAILHAAHNLVLFDFRNHGQSGAAQTTQGAREQDDLRAVIDWLEGAKAPERIAVLGVSMGGAAAVNEIEDDDRIDALILESTHATLANAIQARIEQKSYPLAMPASWAVLLGGLVRTGLDMSATDPVQAVERIGSRPLLIISGDADASIGPTDAVDLEAAASGADVSVQLEICPGGGHGTAWEACPDTYPEWVLGFLDGTLGQAP